MVPSISTRNLLILLACLTAMGAIIAAAQRNQASLSTLSLFQPSLTVDGDARWDAGWASLCERSPDLSPTLVTPRDRPSLWFRALALIDTGHFEAALPLFQRLAEAGDDAERAQAYVSALGMDWEGAIERYPKPIAARHGRFWGTIAYLAAQGRYFAGDPAGAGPFYEMADTAYDIQGPLTSLALVDCLREANRPIEAFDGFRQVLAGMPSEDALAHYAEFQESRLAGLSAWHESVPTDERVFHWLRYYRGEVASRNEMLIGGTSTEVPAFHVAVEDIETSPFAIIILAGKSPIVVVNQAINGAFMWDSPPNDVKPFGWHHELYGSDGNIEYMEDFDGRWLCLSTISQPIAYGLQSDTISLSAMTDRFIQAGIVSSELMGAGAIGRRWIITDTEQYSYILQRQPDSESLQMIGIWTKESNVGEVALWLIVNANHQLCFKNLLFWAEELEEGTTP